MDTTNTNPLLSPGELAVGMYITILRWTPVVHEPDVFGAMVGITTATTHEDHSWQGDVLEVKAIQLPYVIVDKLSKHGPPQSYDVGIRLDTRRVTLMELNDGYVKAALRK